RWRPTPTPAPKDGSLIVFGYLLEELGLYVLDKKTDPSVEFLVPRILAPSPSRLLHFVIKTRHRTEAILCQARKKRAHSQTARRHDGPFGLSLLHCTYATIQSVFKAFLALFSSMSNRFSFPRVGGRGVSKNVGNRDRCAHYCVAHFG